MPLDLPATIDREAGPDTVARVVLWSRSHDHRTTFDAFTTRGDAIDFVEKLAPFMSPETRATVEVVESSTYRIEE